VRGRRAAWTTLKRNSTLEGKMHTMREKKKLQSRIKTAINHSCWASFKYKSISIFHLEPSPATAPKKKVSGWYHHTHNIDRLTWKNLSFLWNTRWGGSIKNVHTKWKLIFSRCDWREIDDVVDDKKKNARLQIALQYELSLYHFTPETRRRVWLFIKNVLLNNSSTTTRDIQPQSYSAYGMCVWWSGRIHFQITRKISNDFYPRNENKIKMCIVKPFNLKTFMLHVR
jgi:hypothetical protein